MRKTETKKTRLVERETLTTETLGVQEKKKTLVVECERKKVQSKTETLASNPPKNPIQSLQLVQTLLKLISGSRNVKSLEEMEENSGENDAQESF